MVHDAGAEKVGLADEDTGKETNHGQLRQAAARWTFESMRMPTPCLVNEWGMCIARVLLGWMNGFLPSGRGRHGIWKLYHLTLYWGLESSPPRSMRMDNYIIANAAVINLSYSQRAHVTR